jgi:2-hydroxychromene-2-carboxylate isomerase
LIELWFEFASTYSYPAAMRAEAAARAAGVELRWRPFLLGPIFRKQGWTDSPFNAFPLKGRYMWRDLERVCERQGIPFRRPTQFPRNGLLGARVATAAAGEPWLGDFVRGVYHANFAADRDIAARETIADVLASTGAPVERALAAADLAETKERLRGATEEAAEAGIFGAPTFRVGNEIFWGNDRLEQALEWALRRKAG